MILWLLLAKLLQVWDYRAGASISGGVGGSWPSKDMHWGGPRVKDPSPIKINVFAICHEYSQNNLSVLTDFSCSKSWKLYITALAQDFIIIFTIIQVCLSSSRNFAQFLFVYVTNSLLCLCVVSVKSRWKKFPCYSRALRGEGWLRLTASEEDRVKLVFSLLFCPW